MRHTLFFALLAACSAASSTAPTDTSPDASASQDLPSTDGAPDAVATDTASPSDAPDAADPRAPQPPAGARRCGEGTLDATEFSTACMAPSTLVDAVRLPDGGTGMTERRCDAASITGGRWEAWCGAAEVYVWARFEGLRATGSYVTCGSVSALSLGIGYGEHSVGGGAGGGSTVLPRGVPSPSFDTGRSTDAVMEYTVQTNRAGSGRFFLGANHVVQCMGMTPTGGMGPNVVIGGTTFRWDPTAM